MPRHWRAPRWWLPQAVCIHGHEGAWPDNTGNTYFGGMQMLENTWTRAGGGHYAAFDHPGDSRYPFTASIREQLYRAWVIYRKYKTTWRPGSWSEWGTRGKCGLG